MTAPARGIQGIKRSLLSIAAVTAARLFEQHVKMCSRCTPNGDFARYSCAEGWKLSKTAHQAVKAYRNYNTAHPAPGTEQQGKLW